jgi:hypothetical protein
MADEIDLHRRVETAYGLLWEDRPTEARAWLLKHCLLNDKERQARGILIAKAMGKSLPRKHPSPIARALEALEKAEQLCAYIGGDADTEEVEAVGFRVARFALEDWSIGVSDGMEAGSDKDSLILCIASAWLHGTISRGRAAELAKTLGVEFSVVENLKFREEVEKEAAND